MAFDSDEISTIFYSQTTIDCPNRVLTRPDNQLTSVRITQRMTWADLHGEHCATIKPGLVYNPDWPENWQITDGQLSPLILDAVLGANQRH